MRRGMVSAALILALILSLSLGITSPTAPAGAANVTPPHIDRIGPNAGGTAGSQPAQVQGSGFTGATSVTFDGIAATITSGDDGYLNTISPAHALGAVDVVVTTPTGTATLANGFTYIAPPTITSISPTSGPSTGGTTVTITGTSLASVTFVGIGGTPVNIVSVSDTQVVVVTAPYPRGFQVLDMSVSTPAGSVNLRGAFTYLVPPHIDSLVYSVAGIAGGQQNALRGSGFTGATSITFGGVAGTISGGDDTELAVIVPTHALGTVDVVVTTPTGTATLANGLTYINPPTVASVSPTSGPATGGTTVTITGTSLASVTFVGIGGTPVNIVSVSDTQVVVVTAPYPRGFQVLDMSVSTPAGSVNLRGAFTYLAPLPSTFAINGFVSPVIAGAGVNIIVTAKDATGTNFVGSYTGTIHFTSSDPQAVLPADYIFVASDNGTHTFPVVLQTAGVRTITATDTATSSLTGSMSISVNAAPTITALDATSGPTTGNTTVTITGANLTGATAVTFGGTASANVVVAAGGTTLTALTPPHTPAGSVDVVVTTPGGTVTKAAAFTYTAPPPTQTGPITFTNLTVTYPNGGTAVAPGGSVTVSAHITDSAGTIVGAPTLRYAKPGGTDDGPYTQFSRTSGTASDGTYTATVSIDQYYPTGIYLVKALYAYDNAGHSVTLAAPNAAVAPLALTVGSGSGGSGGGGGAPVFTAITVAPSTVAPGSTAVVTVTVTGSVSGGSVTYLKPDGTDGPVGTFTKTGDTTYTANILIDGYQPAGVYKVKQLMAYGGAGQTVVLGGTAPLLTTTTGAITVGIPAPIITDISPTSGPVSGGTLVTITGTGFRQGATVTFGGGQGPDPEVFNGGTRLTVLTPALSTGSVTVVVTNPDGQTSGGTVQGRAVATGATSTAKPPSFSFVSAAPGTSGHPTMPMSGGSGGVVPTPPPAKQPTAHPVSPISGGHSTGGGTTATPSPIAQPARR